MARPTYELRALSDRFIDPLFMATVEAAEEAVINALLAAETMTGRDGHVAHAIPHDGLLDVLARHGRGPLAGA
jgi:D-aminopeptidase